MIEKIKQIISDNTEEKHFVEYGKGVFATDDAVDVMAEEIVKLFPIPIVSSSLSIKQIESIKFDVIGSFPYKLKHINKLHPMNNVHGKMRIDGEYYEFVNNK